MLVFREGAPPLDGGEVHRSAPVADLHAHPGLTAYWLKRDLSREHRPPAHGYNPLRQQLDLPRMQQGGLRVLTACVYAPTIPPFPRPFRAALGAMRVVEDLCARAPDKASLAPRGKVREVIDSGRLAVIHAAEGGHHLEGSLEKLEQLAARGLRYLTLTHFVHNGIGRFHDIERNLSDEQLRTVARSGGVVGVITWSWLLRPRGLVADVEDLADAVVHGALVAGPGHVGIGTDFDGYVWSARRIREARHYPALAEALSHRGFSAAELRGILGGNYLRVLGEA